MVRGSLAVLLIVLLSGCALFNPYSSGFECPAPEHGKCQSIRDSYHESVNGAAGSGPAREKGKTTTPTTAKTDYDTAVYGKLRGLLRAPQAPIVAPPQVLRVLILPYQDDKRLYMSRYAYIIVDEPRFVVGDYLSGEHKE